MHVVEQSFGVSKDGDLHIPAKELAEMSIAPGEQVVLAFLSSDGKQNDYREFLVFKEPQRHAAHDESQLIQIPIELLNKASIPNDADVDIACINGAVLILRSGNFGNAELEELLRRLGVVNKELRLLIQEK